MTSLVERELLIFWQASQAVRTARRVPAHLAAPAAEVEDLEAIAMHSTWPRLRSAAAAAAAPC